MNRHERRRAEAQRRAHEARLQKDAGERIVPLLPDDIKRDIAKVVRSIDWEVNTCAGGPMRGGLCFFRAMSGWLTLKRLGITALPALGGMLYRAGPDEVRDVVAFCGPGNLGTVTPTGLLGHYFVMSDGNIVDFSPGDWRATCNDIPDLDLQGQPTGFGPVQWTAPPPDYFWAPRESFLPEPGQMTPGLGSAWYNGFAGDHAFPTDLLDEFVPGAKEILPHIDKAVELYALKERVSAAR